MRNVLGLQGVSFIRFAFFWAPALVVSVVASIAGGCAEANWDRRANSSVTSGSTGDDHSMDDHLDAGHARV